MTSTTNDILQAILDKLSGIFSASGGAIPQKYQSRDVTDAPTGLSPSDVFGPAPLQDPLSALLVLEADPGAANKEACARFTMDAAVPPDANTGLPLGHLGTIKLENLSSISSFQIVSIEPGKTHKLRIHYFN